MARFLKEHKLLIQHIPRCGGTSIEQYVDVLGLSYGRMLEAGPRRFIRKHLLLGHYYPKVLVRTNKIAIFVRHPKSLYESLHAWMSNLRPVSFRWIRRRPWHPKQEAVKQYHPNFPLWVDRMLTYQPAYITRLFEQYCGPVGGEFVDYVGRTENLADDFVSILRAAGYSVSDEEAETLRMTEKQNPREYKYHWPTHVEAGFLHIERLAIERYQKFEDNRWRSNG